MRLRNSSPLPTGRKNLCGAQIRRLRKEAGLSQEQLAERLQLAGWDADQVAITTIETGTRTVLDYELRFLLEVFGKTHHDIDW